MELGALHAKSCTLRKVRFWRRADVLPKHCHKVSAIAGTVGKVRVRGFCGLAGPAEAAIASWTGNDGNC
jgi:hypothetical protein